MRGGVSGFNYNGRPVRMTLDDKDLPELTEAWEPEQKKLVEDMEAKLYGVNDWLLSRFEATEAKVS
jgi:hypothetical protein